MEELLCERRSTISYKDGSVFRKYYKYANENDVIAEKEASIKAFESGVNCPQFIRYGYSDEKGMFFSEFEFISIKNIDRHFVNEEIVRKALNIINLMPEGSNTKNSFNNEKMKENFFSIVSFLPTKSQKEYQYLVNRILAQKREVLIHGDYSFENIGWDVKHNTLIVFDFQNSGYGVRGWDKAYLLASLPNTQYKYMISEKYHELIKIVAALKYGRGIRKGIEIEERKKIYEYWW